MLKEEKAEKVLKVNGKFLKVNVPKEDFSPVENKLSRISRNNYNVPKGKLDMLTASLILEAIRNGLSLKRVCALAGILTATLTDWLKKGQAGYSEKYIWFYNACLKAEVDCEHGALKVVQDAIEGGLASVKERKIYSRKGRLMKKEVNKTHLAPSWTAAMTLLERRFPERWGRYDRLRIGEDPENPFVSKNVLLDFLVNYVGKDKAVIDIEGKVVEQKSIEKPKDNEEFLLENR